MGRAEAVSTRPPARYDSRMAGDVQSRPQQTPILRKALAGIVLLAVAALVVTAVVHFILAILWIVVGIVAVGAVIWALNALL